MIHSMFICVIHVLVFVIFFADSGMTQEYRYRCGAGFCNEREDCLKGRCLPKGSKICGSDICSPNEDCLNNRCLPKGSELCGAAVCGPDQDCLKNRCLPKGSQLCGASICNPNQVCLKGRCLPKKSKICGSDICSPNEDCLNNRCLPKGSELCGAAVCGPDQDCLKNRCLPKGSQLCGASICNPGQVCLKGRCLPKGSKICGSDICSPNEDCLNNRCQPRSIAPKTPSSDNLNKWIARTYNKKITSRNLPFPYGEVLRPTRDWTKVTLPNVNFGCSGCEKYFATIVRGRPSTSGFKYASDNTALLFINGTLVFDHNNSFGKLDYCTGKECCADCCDGPDNCRKIVDKQAWVNIPARFFVPGKKNVLIWRVRQDSGGSGFHCVFHASSEAEVINPMEQ